MNGKHYKETKMRDCRNTIGSKFNKIGAVIIYPLCMLGSFLFSVSLARTFIFSLLNFNNVLITLLVFIISIKLFLFLFQMAYNSLRLEFRRFFITKDGFVIYELFGKTRKCTWSDINAIVVSAFQISASRQGFQTVICIFYDEQPSDFVTGMSSYFYGLRNLDKFVIMDYNEELYNEISNLSQKRIVDYRSLQVFH